MANAIEKLFNDVAAVAQSSLDISWPDAPDRDRYLSDIPEILGSPDDLIITLDEYRDRNRVFETVADRRIAPEDRELISGGLRNIGLDVLAFYKSRRFINTPPAPSRWGIFYLTTGIDYLALMIDDYYPTFRDPMALALEFLRRHEHFHYRADVHTLFLEAALKKQLYVPVRKLFAQRAEWFVEEALANRQVWDWAKQPSIGIEDFAHDIMSLQPREYARFAEDRLNLAAEWAGIVVEQLPPGRMQRHDLKHWLETTPKSLTRSSLCPQYVIQPARLASWISPVYRLPPVNSIDDDETVKKACAGRYASYRKKWGNTKKKLLERWDLPSLDFKPWPNDGPNCCSVRIDDKFRGHLRHEGGGHWLAYKLGPHAAMGHG